MPFLISFKSLLARSPKSKGRGEGYPSAPRSDQLAARPTDNPAQYLPTPAPPAPVPTIKHDQPANPGKPDLNTAAATPIPQPPVIINDSDHTAASSSTAAPTNPIVETTSDLLTGAHHFTIGQLTAISQNIHTGVTVFQQLKEKGKLTAIHDSSARAYPPRCHPSTRKTLRGRVIRWGMGDGNDERMFWVLGPPAVGKSAIAQTIAEEFEEKERFGASFFFSRPNRLDDPDWVIPTLVYQLATKHPQYKRIITQRLVDDPSILDKNRQVQFKKLIIEPFRILMTECPHTVQKPLLIVLDGLDECKDKQAQCEIVELISTHVRQVEDFPLRWMICSRPEWHLRTILSDADCLVVCQREELQVDDKEAREDVERLLEAGFGKIRREYGLSDDWPSERHLQYIVFTASGHLGLASFILKFIEDEEYDDPNGQLKSCIKFLGGGGTVGVISPLHALDLLYRQILSNIPHNRLPTTMRILAFVILYNRHYYGLDSSDNQARFLNLDPTTFYQSLRNLHSVVYVPPMDKSDTIPLRIYHASFSDFLTDRNRSGKYWLDEQAANYDFALQCLHWLENDDGLPSHKDVIKFCASQGWDAYRKLSDDFIPAFINRLEGLDFSRLTHAHTMMDDPYESNFVDFLRWLYSLRDARDTSVITVAQESSPEHVSKEIRVEYCPPFPNNCIASFIPDTVTPTFPFILQLRLGKVTRAYVTLIVVDHGARRSVRSFREGFDAIRQEFGDRLPASWPPESHLIRILAAARGDLDVADFILRFIGDEYCGDPHGQLEVCMGFVDGSTTDGIDEIDTLLYRQILSNIPDDILPVTMRVLKLLVMHRHGYESIAASDNCARFLNLDQVTFLRSLQNLHSVVEVPPVSGSGISLVGIYHVPFFGFLMDVNRSGRFCLQTDATRCDFALQCFYWMENDDGSPSNDVLIEFSRDHVWDACCDLSHEFIPALIGRLEHFNLNCLLYMDSREVGDNFGKFLQWLHSLGSIHNKSLISVRQELSQEETSVGGELRGLCWSESPRDYIASFIPGISVPRLPFTLNLRLGKVTQLHISLVVDGPQREIKLLTWK